MLSNKSKGHVDECRGSFLLQRAWIACGRRQRAICPSRSTCPLTRRSPAATTAARSTPAPSPHPTCTWTPPLRGTTHRPACAGRPQWACWCRECPATRSTRLARGGLTSDPTTTRTSRRWVVRGTAKRVGTWAGGKVLYPSGPSALRVLPVLHSAVWHRCTQTVPFPNEKGQWVATCIYRLWSK